MKNRRLGEMIPIIAIIVIISVFFVFTFYYYNRQASSIPVVSTFENYETVLSNHHISVIDMSGRKGDNMFQIDGRGDATVVISFSTIEDFTDWCLSQNIYTVIHYYGNMHINNIQNHEYLFYIDETTIYRIWW